MRCNICGYESEEQFSICPYCGEGFSLNNNYSNSENTLNNHNATQKQFGYDTNFDDNIKNDYIERNKNLNPAIFTPEPSLINKNKSKDKKLPVKEPKGFIRTANGFKISRYIDTGDFYHKYVLFEYLPLFIFFLMVLHEGLFPFIFSKGFVCLLWYIASSVFNGFYSKFLNKFTFEVTPTGIYIHSPIKKYFIPRDNIKQFWFSRRAKSTENRGLWAFLSFLASGPLMASAGVGRFGYGGGAFMGSTGPADKVFDSSNYLTLCRIFFEVDKPIFQDEFLASEYKKITRFIDTGLAFKDPANARFMEQEFERVLGIEDELVEGECDYEEKVKARKDKILMKNRELENEV